MPTPSKASPSAESPRAVAARVLHAVTRGRSLDTALDSIKHPDRALIAELSYGACRWYHQLAALLDPLLQKPFRTKDRVVHALLVVGAYQLLHTRIPAHAAVAESAGAARELGRPWAVGVVNATLRRLQREADRLLAGLDDRPAERNAMPTWLYRELGESWPDDLASVLAASLQRPPMVLRVNRRMATPAAYASLLGARGITARPVAGAPAALSLDEPVGVERLPEFAAGVVSVQDGAAQLAAPLLQAAPGQRVLDACAAPGGKTAHLLETVDRLELTALDRDQGRLQRLHANLRRLGLAAEVALGDASRPEGCWAERKYDRILLDAPCSATGVIRRHPDIKLLRRASDIGELVAVQREILDALWSILAPGGKLLYVTCSILQQENANQIAEFLSRTPEANAEQLNLPWGRRSGDGWQVLPGDNGMDGFFFARMQKPTG